MGHARIGRRLGPYCIEALIGVGGMAEVYRARQTSTDRLVAIKVLAADMHAQSQFTELFRREAHTIAQLQHTHILPVFDFGEDGGSPYLVMPLMQNGTIATRVRGRRVPLEQVIRVGVQIGDALAYAHERGVVHCDVKPGNILLDDRGNCLLTDFGIARMIGATALDDDPLGTPAYMAPEQAAGAAIDGRADVFALGAVLYELAVGARPFRKDDAYAQIHGVPQPPSTIDSSLPQQLDWILTRALARDPAGRFSDASELVRSIQTLPMRSGRRHTAALPRSVHASASTPEPPRRRVPILPAGAAALTLIALLTWASSQPSSLPAVTATAASPAPSPTAAATRTLAPTNPGQREFARCTIPFADELTSAALWKQIPAIGCPRQPISHARAAAVLSFEFGTVVYFAPPGSTRALDGVAYALFTDGSAVRIDNGRALPSARLGRRSGGELSTTADFQSFDDGRIFRVHEWRAGAPITVVLTDGVNGAWSAP